MHRRFRFARHHQLDEVAARHEEIAEARLKEQLGGELYDAIAALAATLRGHPRRSQALAILREWSA